MYRTTITNNVVTDVKMVRASISLIAWLTIAGVILGAFLIVGLPELFREFKAFSQARMWFFGLAMMIMMVFRTEGILPPRPRVFKDIDRNVS